MMGPDECLEGLLVGRSIGKEPHQLFFIKGRVTPRYLVQCRGADAGVSTQGCQSQRTPGAHCRAQGLAPRGGKNNTPQPGWGKALSYPLDYLS